MSPIYQKLVSSSNARARGVGTYGEECFFGSFVSFISETKAAFIVMTMGIRNSIWANGAFDGEWEGSFWQTGPLDLDSNLTECC